MGINVYDSNKDEIIPVTQEWCDTISKAINELGRQRDLIKTVSNFNTVKDKHKLNRIYDFVEGLKNAP